MITIDQIRKEVNRISKTAKENPGEAFHRERILYHKVLSYIVETDLTAEELQRLVRAILRTENIYLLR